MKKRFLFLVSAFLLCVIICSPAVDAVAEDKTCAIEASGEACIYDLKATRSGTLTACTTSEARGVRWRISIANANGSGIVSRVGNGIVTECTGVAQQNVIAGKSYEVIVSYEGPLPGTFPARAQVHLDGPVAKIPDQRPLSIVELQSCRQIQEDSAKALATDEETIACGALIRCRLAPGADKDSFRFTAASGNAVNLRVTEDAEVDVAGCTNWDLYSPSGKLVAENWFWCGPGAVSNLPEAGKYTILVSNTTNSVVDYILSFQGTSGSYQCGTPISYGTMKSGRLEVRGDTDTFSFVGLSGQTINIQVTETSESAGCTNWDLYQPNGKLLAENWFWCGQKTVTLPANGTYTVMVSNSVNSVADYKILVTKVSGP
jgi:hypothetical protein